ncbi:hypothetical protein [Sporisorium scitamineum]|uniref:Uncharacterized protein n=1 Tax=Sporisorium scitamineum TaxID=49012 RepID=A0A0F7S994_9BASI|nr:hypothetical protein [Sporisorium scitamineum]
MALGRIKVGEHTEPGGPIVKMMGDWATPTRMLMLMLEVLLLRSKQDNLQQ